MAQMKRNSPGDCSSCTERWFCKELCPDAERIIGQDYIPQNANEHLSGSLYPKPLPHVDALIDAEHIPQFLKEFIHFYSSLNKQEIKILTLFLEGRTRKEISEILDITTETVYTRTWSIKDKLYKSNKILLS